MTDAKRQFFDANVGRLWRKATYFWVECYLTELQAFANFAKEKFSVNNQKPVLPTVMAAKASETNKPNIILVPQ